MSDRASSFRAWQVRVFAGTWIAYTGFYLCRKNLPIVQPVLMNELGWSLVDLGIVATAFQSAYAAGQFASGVLGDRLGARKMLALGLTITVVVNLFSGFAATVPMLAVLWIVNGFAQSAGWPAGVKTIAQWFPKAGRGRVMGWWSTNYQAGDAVATWLTASVLALGLSWRWGFIIPALVLAALAVPVFLLHRNSPEDVNLPSVAASPADATPPAHGDGESAFSRNGLLEVLHMPAIWGLAAVGVLAKFIIYVQFFWIATYLVASANYTPDHAGFITSLFPVGGVFGVIAIGYASDRLFRTRRMPAAAIMFFALVPSLLLLPRLAGAPWAFADALGITGFLAFGPESVLTGTAAVEFAPKEGAATAVGFVNGIASLAGIPAGIVGASLAEHFGWDAVFLTLAGTALLAGLLSLPLWNVQGRH